MRRQTLLLVLGLFLAGDRRGIAQQVIPDPELALAADVGHLPLIFELNRGQAGRDVRFVARAGAFTVLLGSDRTELVLPPEKFSNGEALPWKPKVVTMELLNANSEAPARGMDLLPGKSNYFIGKQPSNWIAGIPQYGKVAVESVYPGVDVVYYGNSGTVEYDFLLGPGADPNALQFRITGADKLDLNASGDLVLQIGQEKVELQKPTIYQEEESSRRQIPGGYVLLGQNHVGLRLGIYDNHKPLIIDPVLSYSTLIGANLSTTVQGVAVDPASNVYIAGSTYATNYPTVNAFQSSNAGSTDVFITKLSPTGNQILYSTYLGGSGYDTGRAIAVDSQGSAYVTGNVGSGDFPTTPGAFMTNCPGACNTPFLTKILTDGSLSYSTLMGGSNVAAWAIAVDSAGAAYITGSAASDDLPLVNAFQTSPAGGFVQKLNLDGSDLDYSTYLGGGGDWGRSIAVDAIGSAHVVGSTTASNFPLKNALQSSLVDFPLTDAFITKFSSDGSSLVFSTYLGGTSPFFFGYAGDVATGVAVDSFGNVHVTGTSSSCDFPLSLNALSTDCVTVGDDQKVFALTLNATGSQILFSTFLRSGTAAGIAVDGNGNSYVTGTTTATDFPVLKPIESTSQRSASTSFVTELDLSGKPKFSTYLGATGGSQAAGIAVDGNGGIYVAGAGQGDFPLVHPIQVVQNTYYTLFVAKISPQNAPQISLSPRTSPMLALRNVSTVPVTINSITPSPNFTQGGDCGTTLPPGGGCNLVEEGANDHQNKGSVTITANGGTQQKFVIFKSPTGDHVGLVFAMFPTYVSFPPQFLGTSSAAQQIVIRNLGLQSGAISSITVPPGAFSQTNDCPPVLAPGGSCTISVTYTAATIQDWSYVSIVHDPGQTEDSITLYGIGTTSAIATSTAYVEFGSQLVGAAPLARMVNLTNTTPYPATVTGLATTTGFVESDTCAKPLPPHASCRVAISFQPIMNQNVVGTLTANNYGPGGAQSVNLTATGLVNAELTVSPVALDFPQALINFTSGPLTVTLTNASTRAIPITQVQVDAPFSQTNDCLGNLAVGATCQVLIFLKPTQPGAVTGKLLVSFSGSGSPQSVGLTGTGVTMLYFNPSSLVFGQQEVGTQSPETYLSINNSYNQTITLNSFTIQGAEFNLVANGCPPKLKPFQGCWVQLVFAPAGTGLRTGTATIRASDYAEPHVVQLQGVGIGSGQLILSALSLDFGPQTVGTISPAQEITLNNTGSGTVHFSAISDSPNFFRTANNCGSSLASGGSCTISVKFAPSFKGILAGTLTINDDSAGNPHTVSLAGIGQ